MTALITYRTDKKPNAEEVCRVFAASGIRRPIDDVPRIQRMIDHADLIVTAWKQDVLIGIARAITDYAYCCYLSDLAVDRAYQHQGIGRELVFRLRALLGEEVALILLSAPEAMDYYPKIGFDKADNAYVIRRTR
jgi:GNAT superfamily N-acetyltransferase